jgi:signal transduction histidine kinase
MKTIAFASAAHEFKNPLSAIIFSLELLEDLIDHKRGSKYYTTAKNCSNLMLSLVNNTLDFSQLESKKLVLNYSRVNLSAIIDECIDILTFKAEFKHLELSFQKENNFPDFIFTDGNRVKQIIINLISNAIKYTELGFVKVLGSYNEFTGMVNLVVHDTGVGIEPEQVDKLFTAFTKIMKNRNLNKEGVGLGLTVSKNLAVALGGDIEVESYVGMGSKFIVMIPYNNGQN